ncbi:SPOR domain-containing protein [Gallaecimonas xiamenensis]|uniref:Sporulation domain-containing protein n=1 Tax=Gallaecimonas xiamenensis 3-C-1 TaxID=745411 RepID=K2K2K2_9GAMM|nr:sporulation domain-containing protein [Gallaecimonas xiamenensis]EKE77094.1 sporulation domain-containing protein [Gallaecimonas xiamenensis 3-C-1]
MSDALEDLLARARHLLHFGQDPVIIVEPDSANRSHILNRLLDSLPERQDAALLRCKKAAGVRKLRTDLLSQWFQDPVFNPDDTLADSYLRLRTQPAHRLLLIDSAVPVESALLQEWLVLKDEVDDGMGLLLLVPRRQDVPRLNWQPIWLGEEAPQEQEAPAPVKGLKVGLIGTVAVAVLAALGVVLSQETNDDAPTERQAVTLPAAQPLQPVEQAASNEAGENPNTEVLRQPEPAQAEAPVPEPAAQEAADEPVEATPVQVEIAQDPAAQETLPEPAATVSAQPEPQPKPQTTLQPKPQAPVKVTWPQSVPDRHFALQLMGGRDKAKVLESMDGQGVKDWHLVEVLRQGKAFYIIVQGDYPNLDAARSAIKTLPATFRQAGAWPKRYDKIKAEIAAGKS